MNFDYPARRARLARTLQLTDEILLVGAGNVQAKPEISDQVLPFIAHQEYYYLSGICNAPGGIIAYDPRAKTNRSGEDGWFFFVPRVTDADRLWEGRQQLPGQLLGEFDSWLSARAGRKVIMLGAPVAGISANATRTAEARDAFIHGRRQKEPVEIEILRRCAQKTAAGYASILPCLKPGFTERRIQVELEAEYLRRGANKAGYDTIVGTGPNSAILHCTPSDRALREGDFVLIDSGAELDRYVIDVTRTYVAGKPTVFQQDLYQIVLNAQLHAIALCRPGVEWKDIHLSAAVELVSGLVDMGLMRGDPGLLVEQDAHLLFFPNGIGHMVGLGVRDASGLDPGRTKDPRPALANLRMDLILRPGYVVTVEPGIYLIPSLLNRPENRERFDACINWPLVECVIDVGGVRLEDTILVTDGPPENLTRAIPKVM